MMKQAILRRSASTSEGTFGRLVVLDEGEAIFACFTGELPYKDNKARVSCIPAGSYEVQPWHTRKYPRHYNVMDVPERAAILIHEGNFCGDREKGLRSNVEGCILVGKKLGSIEGQKAVLSSKLAFNALRDAIGEEHFILEIRG